MLATTLQERWQDKAAKMWLCEGAVVIRKAQVRAGDADEEEEEEDVTWALVQSAWGTHHRGRLEPCGSR